MRAQRCSPDGLAMAMASLGFHDVEMKDIRVSGSWQRKEGENDGSTWLVVMGPSHELEDFRIAFYEYIKLRGILIIGG